LPSCIYHLLTSNNNYYPWVVREGTHNPGEMVTCSNFIYAASGSAYGEKPKACVNSFINYNNIVCSCHWEGWLLIPFVASLPVNSGLVCPLHHCNTTLIGSQGWGKAQSLPGQKLGARLGLYVFQVEVPVPIFCRFRVHRNIWKHWMKATFCE